MLLIINLELRQHELSNLMTPLDAECGFNALTLPKVIEAVRRVVVPRQGWNRGKCRALQGGYYDGTAYGGAWESPLPQWGGAKSQWKEPEWAAYGDLVDDPLGEVWTAPSLLRLGSLGGETAAGFHQP